MHIHYNDEVLWKHKIIAGYTQHVLIQSHNCSISQIYTQPSIAHPVQGIHYNSQRQKKSQSKQSKRLVNLINEEIHTNMWQSRPSRVRQNGESLQLQRASAPAHQSSVWQRSEVS